MGSGDRLLNEINTRQTDRRHRRGQSIAKSGTMLTGVGIDGVAMVI